MAACMVRPRLPAPSTMPRLTMNGMQLPDVPPGIPLGGDVVQPLRLRHVMEHGIVEYEAGGIADPGDHEDDKEG